MKLAHLVHEWNGEPMNEWMDGWASRAPTTMELKLVVPKIFVRRLLQDSIWA